MRNENDFFKRKKSMHKKGPILRFIFCIKSQEQYQNVFSANLNLYFLWS